MPRKGSGSKKPTTPKTTPKAKPKSKRKSPPVQSEIDAAPSGPDSADSETTAPPATPTAQPPAVASLPPAPAPAPPEGASDDVPVYEIDVDRHFASPTLAAAQRQVLAETERRATARTTLPPPPPRASSPLLASALAIWLVVAGLLLFRPAIVRGPEARPWAPEAGQTEASLRYGLWLANARVQFFLRTQERMPSFLAEAGVMDTTLTLTVDQGTRYRLGGRDGELVLELSSEMSADSFVGRSRAELQGR